MTIITDPAILEAKRKGCVCLVLENEFVYGVQKLIVRKDCPVHMPEGYGQVPEVPNSHEKLGWDECTDEDCDYHNDEHVETGGRIG